MMEHKIGSFAGLDFWFHPRAWVFGPAILWGWADFGFIWRVRVGFLCWSVQATWHEARPTDGGEDE